VTGAPAALGPLAPGAQLASPEQVAAAFAALYADQHDKVLRRLARELRDEQAAEDAMQDVWIKVHRHLPEYLAKPEFYGPGLVQHAATNALIDHKRRGQSVAAGGRVTWMRLDAPAPGAVTGDGDGDGALIDFLPDASEAGADPALRLLGAEAAGAERQARGVMAALLEALPPDAHRVLWWATYGGRTYRELGIKFGLTTAGAKARLARARARLQVMADVEAAAVRRGGGLVFRLATFQDRSGGPDACWPWLGGLSGTRHKFPAIRVGGQTGLQTNARRIAYSLTRTAVPPGLLTPTTCGGHPTCCNPAHLVLAQRHSARWGSGSAGLLPLTPELEALALRPPRGAHLRARRLALGLSLRAMCRAAGMGAEHSAVVAMESEQDRYRIGVGRLHKLLAALDRLEAQRDAQQTPVGEAA
jgi:RNA polymerase sigma factor (sigma-70 family)